MSSTIYEHIKFEVEDGVGMLTFNMPQYSNALDLKGVQETLKALHEAESRDDVGAVMLTGGRYGILRRL